MKRLSSLLVVLLLAGCGAAPDPGAPTAPAATTGATTAADLPAADDESGLRAAAASALAEQRLYAPAADNAIEHYLSLRALKPGDEQVETALVELLPYALIASEQAIARGDFDEARRLVALVGRADPSLPALERLRESLASAEAQAAREAAEAEQRLAQQAARDAAAAAAAEAEATAAAERARLAAANAARAPAAPATTAATTQPAATQPRVATAPPPAAAAAPARPAAAPVPRLLESPPPRYPLMALRRKLEGEVLLELRIRPDGGVAAARVVSATPPGLFDEAAVAAAQRWRFAAGPTEVTTRQVMRFRLPEA